MSNLNANKHFQDAHAKAAQAVELYAKPIGGGARQSIEHQGIQALAEAVLALASGLDEMTRTDSSS